MSTISFPLTIELNTPWDAIPSEKVVEGSPVARSQILYTSNDDCFFAGLYECTAGKWRVSYEEDEFCTLLDGEVRLHDARDNTITTYRAPQSFLIPSGFSGIWDAVTPVRKYFALYERAKPA